MTLETTTKFDLALARLLAGYAAAAYTHSTVLDHWTNASALLACRPDEGIIIVALRGSKSPKDFLADSECWRTRELMWSMNGDAAEVHHGFLEDFESIDMRVIDQVRAGLKEMPGAKVYLCGHSLGGALADLFGIEFHRRGIRVDGVYTFGSPRVGNHVWRDIYDDALLEVTFRIIAAGDLVPLLPGVLGGYRHCGVEVLLDGGSPIIWPNHWFEILMDSNRAWRAMRRRDFDFILQFHSITEDYSKLLGAKPEERQARRLPQRAGSPFHPGQGGGGPNGSHTKGAEGAKANNPYPPEHNL